MTDECLSFKLFPIAVTNAVATNDRNAATRFESTRQTPRRTGESKRNKTCQRFRLPYRMFRGVLNAEDRPVKMGWLGPFVVIEQI